MTNPDALASFLKDLGADFLSVPDPKQSGLRLSAVLPADKLLEAARKLYDDGLTLLDVSTADFKEGYLVTYHFDSYTEPCRIALRLLVTDKANPVAPSIDPVFQGAEFHERESFDFYGIRFEGNPNLIPILLTPDLMGPPPLRKEPEAQASLLALGILGKEIHASEAWKALAPKKEEKEAKDAAEGGGNA